MPFVPPLRCAARPGARRRDRRRDGHASRPWSPTSVRPPSWTSSSSPRMTPPRPASGTPWGAARRAASGLAVSGRSSSGSPPLDVIQQVHRAPGPNEKVSSTARLVCAGGPATNAAVTCAALGVPATLLSAVGHSVLGAAIRADLTACGVRLVDAAAEPQALPPVSAIAVGAGGERSVVSPNDILAVRPVGGPDDPSGLLAEVVGVAPRWSSPTAGMPTSRSRCSTPSGVGRSGCSTGAVSRPRPRRSWTGSRSPSSRPTSGRRAASDAEVLDWLADAGCATPR